MRTQKQKNFLPHHLKNSLKTWPLSSPSLGSAQSKHGSLLTTWKRSSLLAWKQILWLTKKGRVYNHILPRNLLFLLLDKQIVERAPLWMNFLVGHSCQLLEYHAHLALSILNIVRKTVSRFVIHLPVWNCLKERLIIWSNISSFFLRGGGIDCNPFLPSPFASQEWLNFKA